MMNIGQKTLDHYIDITVAGDFTMGSENKKGKEERREKLIQELQDLGQLIAPNDSPSSETESPSEPAPSPPTD